MRARVQLNLGPFKRLKKSIKGPLQGKVLKAVERLIPIYRLFIWKRFLRFSKGGGNWKKLRSSYIKEKKRAGYSTKILERTGILKNQLRLLAGKKGVLVRSRKYGLTVQFAPRKKYRNGMFVKDVLTIHDKGLGQSRRVVLVSPDNKVFQKMAKTVEKGIQAELDG